MERAEWVLPVIPVLVAALAGVILGASQGVWLGALEVILCVAALVVGMWLRGAVRR